MDTEHRLTLADGRTLACLELGEPTGTPVIYFHGCPGSRLEARLTARAIGQMHVRLLAPDRPGFGDSTFQHGRTIGAGGDDIRQLADRFALERFAVIGVSGGGPHTLACAARLPKRVSRVALVGALAPIAGQDFLADMIPLHRLALAAGLRTPRLARIAVNLLARVIRRYPRSFSAHMLAQTSPADRDVLADAWYRTLMLDSTVEALRQGGRGVACELTLLAQPWDIRLAHIGTPTAIWQGMADNIVPASMARYLAGALAHSELHCLPEEGHLSLIVRHAEQVFSDLTPGG
jgi:pimeloyl-ACP methyl ester carboxylesterase